MKKQIFAIITLSALALTACGDYNDAYTVQDAPAVGLAEDGADELHNDIYSEGTDLYNEVYLWPEQECYLPDTEAIRVTISNNTDDEIGLDAERFMLYRVWENGHQEAVPYKDGGDCFNELALLVMPHDSATFIANIAAHYDLPLAEGDYLIETSGMTTGFSVSADAQAVIPAESLISIETEYNSYPAGVTEIKVLITNDGDEPYVCGEDLFGLEHFGDGFVSMTPFAGDPESSQMGSAIAPHSTGEWTFYVCNYGESQLSAGEYAIYLNGEEARFTVTDAADVQNTADNSALPEIVFLAERYSYYVGTDRVADPQPNVAFLTRDGELYTGIGQPLDTLIAAYESQTLEDSYKLQCTVDAAELAAQYAQLIKAAEIETIAVVHPQADPANILAQYLWYGVTQDADGTPVLTQISGEDSVVNTTGVKYATENETVNAVGEWVRTQTEHWLHLTTAT